MELKRIQHPKTKSTPLALVDSESGMVQVLALSLLPLLMGLIFTFGGTSVMDLELSRKLHLCRTKSLEAQSYMGQATEKLQSLNPLARSLRIIKRKLIAISLSPMMLLPPIAKSVILGLQRIQQMQKALDTYQKLIIATATLRAAKTFLTLTHELKRLRDGREDAQVKTFVSPLRLNLKKIPENEIAPEYIVPSDFREKQKSQVTFLYSAQSWMEAWLPNVLHFLNSEAVASHGRKFCSTTLEEEKTKGKSQWYAVLSTKNQVRSLLKL